MIGAHAYYVASAEAGPFQPMNANFGLLTPLEKDEPKKLKKAILSNRSLACLKQFIEVKLVD
jgi:methylenetetrahydrofolate--tRNA-(uracil-5-)-methyltransferase